MATIYTSTFQVLNDLDLFTRVAQNQDLNLGNFQSLAASRWTWIYDNWSLKLKERFKNNINGDEDLEKKFQDFQRFIDSWGLGNRNNPFSNVSNFQDVALFLSQISLSELKLSPNEAALRDQEIDRISRFTIDDFRAMYDFVRREQAIYAQVIGLGDADAAKVTGVGNGARQRTATIDDLDQINQLEGLLTYIQSIMINLQSVSGRQPNVLVISQADLAPGSSISFIQNYQSAIPIPFEISLEHMAKKYMGSSDRWFELVTVNNLLPPYVDEVGEKFTLLAPPASNNLIIADTRKTDISVGTKVKVGSFKYAEETRVIERIIYTDSGTMILFLSGAQTLNKFKPNEGAYVRIYAPQTTRRSEFILIPSTSATPNPAGKTPTSDALRRLDKALLDFGVDILFNDQEDDLVVDASGNFALAAGFANVRQAALNALKTIRGELPWHPTYGVNADIGGRFFGTTDEALIFGELLRETLLQDARFTQVLITAVRTTGTGISLEMIVQIAGSNQPVPLNFVS